MGEEIKLGDGIRLAETKPRSKLYYCETCGYLWIDTKKIPCPRCEMKKVKIIQHINQNSPKITIIVKDAEVP